MQKNFSVVKKYVNLILDIVLGILGVFLLVFMASYLVDLATYLMKPMTPDNFSVIMQEIISFFMLFEFIMMILRYIQEGHHDSLFDFNLFNRNFTSINGCTWRWLADLIVIFINSFTSGCAIYSRVKWQQILYARKSESRRRSRARFSSLIEHNQRPSNVRIFL